MSDHGGVSVARKRAFRRGRSSRIRLASLIVTWLVLIALGASAGPSFSVEPHATGPIPWHRVSEIFFRNLLAALGLYSGALTLGVTTVPLIILTALYIGAIIGGTVSDIGFAATVGVFGSWLPFEIAGLIAASHGGLMPVGALAAAITRHLRGTQPSPVSTSLLRGALAPFALSLRSMVVSAVLLAIGAVVETANGLPQ